MLGRNDILEVVRRVLAEILGIDEMDVTGDCLLEEDLGLEIDDLEDVAARIQSAIAVNIAPDELFPDDSYDQLTVQEIVNCIEQRIGTA